jgi:alkylhydroperoxidase/carboxymuconolactone decarboxylase family protein YurZ
VPLRKCVEFLAEPICQPLFRSCFLPFGIPALLHAQGALRAGATLVDLVGVAETSLVTAGIPAYALAIEIIAELLDTEEATRGATREDAD